MITGGHDALLTKGVSDYWTQNSAEADAIHLYAVDPAACGFVIGPAKPAATLLTLRT